MTPNDPYRGRTAPLTSKCCILYIYSTNIGTEYFKHGIYSPFFPLQNAVCFTILTYLVPVLFTFYIQGVPKLKKINSGTKRLRYILVLAKRETLFYASLLRKATKNLSAVKVGGQFRTLRVSGTSLKCYHLSWITRLDYVCPLRVSACKPALTGQYVPSNLRCLRGNVTRVPC